MTTARPRPGAYIWVTWIAPLLAGDARCLWAAWFKAHFFYTKHNGFDATAWQQEHAPMLAYARESLADDGLHVQEEEQNTFALTSNNITLAGKPDLVVTGPDRALIVDCKSGSPHEAHRIQVMIYMAVLPCVRPELKELPLEGVIQYKDSEVRIPASAIDPAFRARLRRTIHLVGGSEMPPRIPSLQECRFCSISASDCPERIDAPHTQPITDHDLF